MAAGFPIVAWVLFTAASFALVILYRQKQSVQLFADDLKNRLDVGREAYGLIKQELDSTRTMLNDARQAVGLAEETIQVMKGRLATKELQFQRELKELKTQTEQSDQHLARERRLAHLEEENEVLKQQLGELDKQLATAHKEDQSKKITELVGALSKAQADLSHAEEQLHKKRDAERQNQSTIKTLEKKLDAANAILRHVDPEESKRTKRKAKQMEQLYTSMKGLKELVEERNRNWEVALRHLSAYVLKSDAAIHLPIGKAVGAALEAIGASLVVDEFQSQVAMEAHAQPQADDPVAAVIADSLSPRSRTIEGASL